jgi:hypothetical protein
MAPSSQQSTTVNDTALILNAALAEFCLAYLLKDHVRAHLDDRRPQVLSNEFPVGFKLLSLLSKPPAFVLLANALCHRGSNQTHPLLKMGERPRAAVRS